MSKAIVLNEKFENNGEVVLPASYEEINSHNLYLYVKSYLASLRAKERLDEQAMGIYNAIELWNKG